MKKTLGANEFGDFQTPMRLVQDVCDYLSRRGVAPAAVVEPTCGLGNFVLTAFDLWPQATHLGVEINTDHIAALRSALGLRRVRVEHESFFHFDWRATFQELRSPVLVLGNPPWVTNAQLGTLGSSNLPQKTNFQGHVGLDALTGKSNFDISEWMLIKILESLAGRRSWLAMLCKTSVARKALIHAWKTEIGIEWAEMRAIDAKAHFGAAVDACLLVCSLKPDGRSKDCGVYEDFVTKKTSSVIGWCDKQLVADVPLYQKWKHLIGESPYQWRSGIKHDCSKVMELRKDAAGYRNGLGELVELEADYMYPMLKSSELANDRVDNPVRWMLVTQRSVGEETRQIRINAPKTWAYLHRNITALENRGSSIYKGRPSFSIFGVGDYTFSPWKVGISGFYKRLKFVVVGNSNGRPTVLDDTGYFLPCQSEREARSIASMLNTKVAHEFFSAFTFWDAKRPITVDLLRKLNLTALARELGLSQELAEYVGKRTAVQPNLFDSRGSDMFAS